MRVGVVRNRERVKVAHHRKRQRQTGLSALAQLSLIVAIAVPAVVAFKHFGEASRQSIAEQAVSERAVSELAVSERAVSEQASAVPSSSDVAVGSRSEAFGFGTAGRAGRAARFLGEFGEKAKHAVAATPGCTGTHCAPGSGMCFVAGTQVMTADGAVAIEDLTLGTAVETIATGAHDAGFVSEAWSRIVVQAQDTRIELLRPSSWIASQGLEEGGSFDLALAEMGVQGSAQILSMQKASAPKADAGFAVTGLYQRDANDVYTLKFGDETVEPTGKHRFFSVDRNDWVATQELRVGERLRTEAGDVTLDEIERKPGVHRVYNLEVAHEHTYLVSTLRLYTHNQYSVINTRIKPETIDTTFANVRQLGGDIDARVNPPLPEITDELIQEARAFRVAPEQRAQQIQQERRLGFDQALEQSAVERFGEGPGTELFIAGLRDIRFSIGDERFMAAMVKSKQGADYDSKLVTSLALLARGDANQARKLITEAEQISPSGQKGIYRGLFRRLEVLADVFDEKVKEIPAERINRYFRDQQGPVADPLSRPAQGIQAPPDAETLRLLDRFDGRQSRYVVDRQGGRARDLTNNANTPTGNFLNQTASTPYANFLAQLNPTGRDAAGSVARAVRDGDLEGALAALRKIVAKENNFALPNSLQRGQAIERLEDTIQTITGRFRKRDEPFTRRATSPDFDLNNQATFFNVQPPPVSDLSFQLARDLAVNQSDAFRPRDGVQYADLVTIMNDAFRASIRGDVDGIAPRLERFAMLLSDENRLDSQALRDLLRQDLEEFADLYRRGERTSKPPALVIDPDPPKVDARGRKRGAELADELAQVTRPSTGN